PPPLVPRFSNQGPRSFHCQGRLTVPEIARHHVTHGNGGNPERRRGRLRSGPAAVAWRGGEARGRQLVAGAVPRRVRGGREAVAQGRADPRRRRAPGGGPAQGARRGEGGAVRGRQGWTIARRA